MAAVALWVTDLPPETEAAFAAAATALPMLAYDLLVLKVHRRTSTGLRWQRAGGLLAGADLGRVAVKLLGLAATWAVIALGYWAFPEYHGDFYAPFWTALSAALPWLAVAAVPYFLLLDGRMAEPRDAYWRIGALLLGRRGAADAQLLWQHALGWSVKAFFLPLMFVWLSQSLAGLLDASIWSGDLAFSSLFDAVWRLSFVIDLAFGLIGYCLTLRVIDSHIRSTEPTMLGWAVALACYPPFWAQISEAYLAYDDQLEWGVWLADWPVANVLWGTAIAALALIYAAATVAFGCRFSNLTHRGILTSGLYRWSKHPAYLSKNLFWWLVAVPFISSEGSAEAARHCLLLLGVNLLYYLRARTEERHLSRDPDYVAYALWMNEHALLSRLGRMIPALRYRAPVAVRS